MIEITYGTPFFDTLPWEPIGFAETEKEAMEKVEEYINLNKMNKAPYRRMWKEFDGSTIIDFGSHSRFFKLKEY